MSRQPVIAIAFYSTWGHVAQLAEKVIKGVEATGAIAKPYIFQETLPEEVRTKMHAAPQAKYPVIKPDDLKEVDGFIIGAPTRYGRLPAQVSTFFDACGQLWAAGALVGKAGTIFTSVAGQHGGHETTALTSMPFFIHHGMVYVPISYGNPLLSAVDKVQGGSPWGASTVSSGDGSLQPTENDLAIAEYQGKSFADYVTIHVRGQHLIASDKSAGGASTATDAPTLGKVIPATTAVNTKNREKDGYQVPESRVTESAPPATTASEPAATPAPAAATATATPEPVATTETKAAPAPAAAAAKPQAQHKKGGLFASCCGGKGIDN